MHSCWLSGEIPPVIGTPVPLSAEESAHVARVLRMKVGDEVHLMAGGSLFMGVLATVEEKAVLVRVLSELPSPESRVRITLLQGLPKLDKLEWIVQKVTELGAWTVQPVEMERSVARMDGKEQKKADRLQRIALEAAKQSGRAHVPEVLPTKHFTDAVRWLSESAFDLVLVAWEEENALRLSEAVTQAVSKNPALQTIALIIGPEGGISSREVEQLTAMGARCVTLGKRILRTETAGLCAVTATMCALGEL